jgi:hypothetical protein
VTVHICAHVCVCVCVCVYTSVQEKAGCVKQNFQYESYLLLKAVTVQTDVLTVEMSSGCSETSIHLCFNRRLYAYGHATCVTVKNCVEREKKKGSNMISKFLWVVQIVTLEFAFDLGSGLRFGKPTLPSL